MGVAALTAVATVSGGLAAAPARADSNPISISVFGSDTTLGVSGIGKDLTAGLNVETSTSPTGTATNVTLAIDFSGLAGMATISTSNPACTTSGTVITCDFGAVNITDYIAIPSPTVQIHVSPVAGAQVSQVGQYTLTGSADGVAPVSIPQNVTLADGPDMTGSGYAPYGSPPPVPVALKSKVSTPKLTVTNDGSASAEGVTIVFNSAYEFPFYGLARNCEYAANHYSYGSLLFASCYFPNVITPGDAYTLENTQRFTVRPDTIHDFESIFSADIVPGYQPPTAVDSTLKWVPGTEDPLVLTKTSGPGTPTTTPVHVTQTNIDPYDGWNNLVYQASNGVSTDLAAIGAKVEAPKGSTVNVTVGVHNNGPGTEDFGPALADAADLQFTPPPGTTVTAVPSNCFLANNGAYVCSMAQILRYSTSAKVTFTLQVSATGATGEGQVFVYHGSNGGTPTGPDVYDTVWTNNVAPVRITS
ncbi:MAG TPA: hypothetical protein VGZ32_26605 [Actinocrinis sp.]|jgi:hypothetical protein|uniref:hypothetical protein n=1 Tax=Actinocrinis sp. TaxID=1920516 RepID=UPI002DDCCC27|nr:hypothetical protein [Actinocrinis sp.]HEV3173950.1 hypothetical protein [Actinocrinis sp.]